MLAVFTICRWLDAFNKCNIESLTAVVAVFATRYYTPIRIGIPLFNLSRYITPSPIVLILLLRTNDGNDDDVVLFFLNLI